MSKSFSRIADTYDRTRGGVERGRRFAAALGPLLPDGPVLEVGIGTGLIALGLAERGREVLGVDISYEMIAQARSRIGPRVSVGDARRLPVRDGSVRAAYTVWVLHLVDPERTLAEIARVLGPGGTYLAAGPDGSLATDPLGRTAHEMWDALRDGRPSGDEPESVKRAAAAAGLRFVRANEGTPARWNTSVNEVIRRIEERSFSILWDLPAERWEAIVEPTLAALRKLPDPDAPIERRASDVVLEFRRR